ncbi:MULTISPECIES: DUF4179 domain-containing protein [unclassified Paenibacillus]|uniref:DUF4179 domain-containing protein n=1 Tax=unclassified Paenibacillus TaxID=185978 RepID=UPI002406C82B|nr:MULTISPECIES: DUF4179 domain-containing protein [unclassified Paenibacillus]MDF9843021.1 hypothetical protein [Paenibacillus sp. PastF-2]MDF9849609.1 hypothetical protein [Paenibacillus sp. PastM-2]MDF9856016.1 hypothetical protein [Paenibacillus sp. PastF-1]MDH6481452.1 hypothetical protein [Paenibacillus sp. PastH-2]MDH6508705.1 hypothetical protein [Paenibacillus sp. PastM-3]
MINSREEQVMTTDAARMQREIQAETDNHYIRLAVQNGLERGVNSSKRAAMMKGSIFGLAAAAMIAVLLFIIPVLYDKQQPTTAKSGPADWGVLEPFREFNGYDINSATFESAVRNDYIQLLDQGVEVEGYMVTLNAVTADENRIILLYTAETSIDQEIYGFSSSRMLDVQTGSLLNRNGGVDAHAKINGEDNYHKYYGKSVFELDRSKPFPTQLEADFLIASVDPGKMDDPRTGTIMADIHYSPRIKVTFNLDQKFKEIPTKVIHPDKSFLLAGHEVVLSQVELSPLMIRARFALKNEAENTWEVRRAIFEAGSGKVIAGTGKGTVELPLLSAAGTDNGFEELFASTLLDDPESLVLEFTAKTGDSQSVMEFDLLK